MRRVWRDEEEDLLANVRSGPQWAGASDSEFPMPSIEASHSFRKAGARADHHSPSITRYKRERYESRIEDPFAGFRGPRSTHPSTALVVHGAE